MPPDATTDPRTAYNLAAMSPSVHFESCAKIKDARTKAFFRPTANVLQRRIQEAYEVLSAYGYPAIRIIVTKIRQCGGTTVSQHIVYHKCKRENTDALVIADTVPRARMVLERFREFDSQDKFPWQNPLVAQATNMQWLNGSTATITSAESRNPGIAAPRQAILFSESCKYPRGGVVDDKDIVASVMPSLNDAGLAIAESTPEGASGWHYDTWQGALNLDEFIKALKAGEHRPGNGWCKVFAAWFEFEENAHPVTPKMREQIDRTLTNRERNGIDKYGWTHEQIYWRRSTIQGECGGQEDLFDEYYPEDEVSCIEGSVRIPTQRGLIPIEEVRAGDVSNGQIVKEAAFRGVKPTIILTTHQGFRVTCTPDHRLQLQSGDWVQASQTLGRPITLAPPQFALQNYTVSWSGFGGVTCNLTLNEKWGLWLGLFMGDGSFYKNQLSIVCDGRDRDTVAKITRLSRGLFGRIWTLRRPKNAKAIELRSYSAAYKQLFSALGLLKPCHHGLKRRVHVPECIWRSPREVVRQFLIGIFETDGWISATGRTAQLFAKDPEFLREVQQLLLGFGIQSSLTNRSAKVKGKEYPGGQLYIYNSQVDAFIENIGFLSSRKQERCAKGYKKAAKTGRKRIIDQGFDTVANIQPGEALKVYDLEMQEEPTFAAGGIKVHNCFLSSGRPRFNMASVLKLEKQAQLATKEIGTLTEQDGSGVVQFVPDPQGMASFHLWERPRVGCRYLVWCDPATGEDQTESNDPDRHSIGVLRCGYTDDRGAVFPDAVVARVRPPFTGNTLLAADFITLLSRYYGNAIVVLEINMGLHILERLKEEGIPIYQRQVIDPYERETQKMMYGWKLKDRDQRRTVVDCLALAIHEESIKLNCPHIASECRTFIIDKNGKEIARSGCKDDDVMGLAMALFCKGSGTLYREPTRRRRLPADHRKWR